MDVKHPFCIMKQFQFKRDDNAVFTFSCCSKSDLMFGTYSASSFPLNESPVTIPTGIHLIPSRGNASSGFLSDISSFSSVISESDLAGHTFIVDATRSFSFNAQLSQVTFTIGNNSTTFPLSGYCTLPYCDEFPVTELPSFANPFFLWEFNWYGATPDVARIYGSTTCYPEVTTISQTAVILYNFFDGIKPIEDDTDPYSEGGNSDGGGGTGDFDDTSDTIPIPNLPSVTGLNTGFFTAFVCTPSEMRQLSNYLWNNVITDILNPSTQLGDKIDALKKVVANPYDAIMGCSLIPVTPSTGGSKEVKMYGILSTGLNFSYADSRWVSVDCGTLNINEYWGGYLDYSPYTKTTSLYLPYIGTVSIDIDLIMGKALQVVYHVDILTGICIAYILVDGSVEFQYQGQCSTQIPITNADYSGSIQAGIGLVGNIANIVTGGIAGSSGGIAGAVAGATSKAVSQTPAIAGNVMGMKPDIKSGGGVGSSGGILGVQKPYLIIERPRQSLPKNQNSFTGYPCNRTMKIGDCLGYTEIEDIKLDNIPLTDTEKEELLSILQKGVYFANE